MAVSQQDGFHLLFHMLSVIGQSIFFGVLIFTFPVSVYILVRRISSTSSKVLLATFSLMFLLSAMFWVGALLDAVFLVLNLMNDKTEDDGLDAHRPVYNALVLINFVITDGVVVWRAWAINRERRTVLLVCVSLLALTGATALLVIVVRMITLTPLNRPFFTSLIDTVQTVNLGLSLLTNLLATIIISIKAWKYRAELSALDAAQKQSPVERALLLLVESGAIYCVSAIIVLFSTIIHLPFGTLGDIYQPIHSQLSGVYPTAVLILVSQQKSLENNVISSELPGRAGAARGSGSNLSPGSQQQLETMQFRQSRLTRASYLSLGAGTDARSVGGRETRISRVLSFVISEQIL